MNICGCIVHVAPRALASAEAAIAAEDGVEIHARAEGGRFVVTVEDTDARNASEAIMALHQIPGVLSVTLNYHHFEDLSARAALATPQPEN